MVAVLFGWGAWQRRWIADDGLIVLRTVRNLLAGNGPVFNQGERVEANTSVVWTYLVYFAGSATRPMRLEYVALALALGLSLLGLALLMLGTGRLFAPSLVGRRAIMLPAGALAYIAVPPARDFATSGLESGLVMAYLGLLWWMMVCWSQAKRSRPPGRVFIVALAFVAGCSVLVRPELALIGGLALIMMLIAAQGWRRRTAIVVAGGLLPVGYQIFRMGYYGLLFPGTALAKDAAGDKWSQGLIYLSNFNRPYALWVPMLLLAGLGLVLWASARRRKGPSTASSTGGPLARTRAEPGRGRGVHPVQRVFAGAVLDSARRGFHARPGAAGPADVSARTGGGGAGGVPRRHQAFPRGRILVGRRGQRAVDGDRGMGAVGGQFARVGRRRHPRHLLGHRGRAALLLAGNGPRASADGRRLSGLPPDARGAGGAEQHPGGRAATAVRQLRPVGPCPRRFHRSRCRARRRTVHHRLPKRGRTQSFSPTSAWWA